MAPPQAFSSAFPPRLRSHLNGLLTPVISPSTAQPPASRTTKRGTVVVSYAEDLNDDDFEDSDGPKRPTGLRSRRDDPTQRRETLEKTPKELTAPIEVQGIWRDWMGKPKFGKYAHRADRYLHAQASLPLTLIPIRIDLLIDSFIPDAALPLPPEWRNTGVNPHLPAYRKADQATPQYRLKDIFLWNLHETLMTPDQFALMMVAELDLETEDKKKIYAVQISNQIRQQLEEYAGVALHPLFHTTGSTTGNGTTTKITGAGSPRDQSATPADRLPSTPLANAFKDSVQRNGNVSPLRANDGITAVATPILPAASDVLNPDDTYRCIITLNINILNKLYTDRFEWSLLHPPGVAEMFAKQTCGDMGLSGEWVPAMTHAIYEAVLRLKKEACESGGLVGGGDIDNLALEGQEAGWRLDPEGLADEWEPKLEVLSKEEIEKRETERERQMRRLRRETARFSSTTNMAGGVPAPGGYFDQPENPDTPMGRGERSKKKRRFRSLSPIGRGATPGGTPDAGTTGYGGAAGLNDWERYTWRCSHCLTQGQAVWAVRDGPNGPRSLCNNCGLHYEREKRLSAWTKDLHRQDGPSLPRH
ncbi:Chromatin structure remodeling complex protein sfh1 [Trapelia coarctata]|nr:Chromatin structure remodeling complex protein sfh1 [Trapelia coarctata]